jgi:hypothetical protein
MKRCIGEIKMKKRKTAREKLEKEQERKVVDDPRGRGMMLIPKPLDVDAMMCRVGKGELVIVDQIRERLAKDYGADFTCPLTTGIFLRIVAEAAEEDLSRGFEEITPYWRTLKAGGVLNEKYPGGIDAQAVHLREEGHTVESGRGKKPPKVKDFERALVEV